MSWMFSPLYVCIGSSQNSMGLCFVETLHGMDCIPIAPSCRLVSLTVFWCGRASRRMGRSVPLIESRQEPLREVEMTGNPEQDAGKGTGLDSGQARLEELGHKQVHPYLRSPTHIKSTLAEFDSTL